MTDELFLAQFRDWIARDARRSPTTTPGTGACALATAMQMWLWTLQHLQEGHGCRWRNAVPGHAPGRHVPAGRRAVLAAGRALPDPGRDGAGSRRAAENPVVAEGLAGTLQFLTDLCHVQAAHGRRRSGAHLRGAGVRLQSPSRMGSEGCATCYQADELEALEATDSRHRQPGARLCRCDRERRFASRRRPVRARGSMARAVQPPARTTGRLPDRLAAGQGSRRRSAHQGDDSRGTGLPGMRSNGPGGLKPRRRRSLPHINTHDAPPWTSTSSAWASARPWAVSSPPRAKLSRNRETSRRQVICYERADESASASPAW